MSSIALMDERRTSSADKIPWVGAGVLLLGLLWIFFGKGASSRVFGPAVPFEIQSTDVRGVIHVRWNGQADNVSRADDAMLEVRDGAHDFRFPVSRLVLRAGALDYTRKTDDVVANLVLFRNGHETERRIVRSISAPRLR